jgi:hypothetical protein
MSQLVNLNIKSAKQLLEGATRSHVLSHYAEVRRSAETITIDFNFGGFPNRTQELVTAKFRETIWMGA